MNNNLDGVSIYVAPTKNYINSSFYPDGIRSELDNFTASALIKQKYAVWGLIYQVLQSDFNVDLTKINVKKNQFGKPFLDNGLFISYSHNIDLITVAISRVNIGVDIERIAPERLNDRLTAKILHQKEICPSLTDKDVYNFWTKKEAIFKWLGNSSVFIAKNINTEEFKTKSYTICFDNKNFSLSVAFEQDLNINFVLFDEVNKF